MREERRERNGTSDRYVFAFVHITARYALRRYEHACCVLVCAYAYSRLHTQRKRVEGERKRAIAVRRRSNQDKFARLRIKRRR